MTRISLPLALAALLAFGGGTALAQTPTPTTPAPPPTTTPDPPPPPAASATIDATGGLGTEKTRYYAPFQQVTVKGRVRPAVPGEIVRLRVVRGGKVVQRARKRVGKGGTFAISFKVGSKPGKLRLVVDHEASAAQAAWRAKDEEIQVVRWQAGEGASGVPVLLLQRALKSMGFVTPATGKFDDATGRAVLAFRKTNEMERNGYASAEVYAKLFRGQGAYKLRYPKAGKHVEFDWSRQVLVLARNGKPERVYHSSSGAPATPTVFGKFNFYMKTPGTNSLGMVHSSYFIRGYAIHGYASVPNYPASHGCLRVPIPNALEIYNWVDIGDPIWVYK